MCIQYVGYFCIRKKLIVTAAFKTFTRENKLARSYNRVIIFWVLKNYLLFVK